MLILTFGQLGEMEFYILTKCEVFGTLLNSVLLTSFYHLIITLWASCHIPLSGPSTKSEVFVFHTLLDFGTSLDSDTLGFLRVMVVTSPSAVLSSLLELLSANKKLFTLPDALNPTNNHIQVTCKN